MAAKKPGLTLEQHRELGSKLKEMRSSLMDWAITVSNSYPKGSKESASLMRVLGEMDKAKNILDSTVYRETKSDDVLSIYIGPEGMQAAS